MHAKSRIKCGLCKQLYHVGTRSSMNKMLGLCWCESLRKSKPTELPSYYGYNRSSIFFPRAILLILAHLWWFGGWGFGVKVLGFWGWGFQLMGFRACSVGPSGFWIFWVWGCLHKHTRITLGKNLCFCYVFFSAGFPKFRISYLLFCASVSCIISAMAGQKLIKILHYILQIYSALQNIMSD